MSNIFKLKTILYEIHISKHLYILTWFFTLETRQNPNGTRFIQTQLVESTVAHAFSRTTSNFRGL